MRSMKVLRSLSSSCFKQGCLKIPDKYFLSVLTPTSKHLNESVRVCAESFVDEPASMHLEGDRSKRFNGWMQFVGQFIEECASNDMSVICIDQEKDAVASVLLLRDFASDLPPLLVDCVEQWKDPDFAKRCDYAFLGPLLEILVDVDEKYKTKAHPECIYHGTVVDLWMAGTNARYRRQGLMNACCNQALGLAHVKGYQEAIGECINQNSNSVLCRLGAKPVVATTYAGFKLSNGSIGWKVEPPHTKIEIVSFDLSE